MFVEDYMIFSKANRSAARYIKTILENPCKGLGQLINYHKSNFQKVPRKGIAW